MDKPTNTTVQFKERQRYVCRSPWYVDGDDLRVWVFLVMRRTAKSVWLAEVNQQTGDIGEVKRKRIIVWRGLTESCYPLGHLARGPHLCAHDRWCTRTMTPVWSNAE